MHSRALKIGLIIVLFTMVVTIAWSFLSRRRQVLVIPEGEMLPPQISRRTTQFEYSERKRDRTVFHVQAEVSTELEGGIHTLSDVRLTRYDIEGSPAETVVAEKAVYEMEKRQLQFSDKVQIELADKTRIFTEHTRADLDREVIYIEENFRFELGEAEGKGRSLFYRIPHQEVNVTGSFELTLPNSPGSLKARAEGARYRVLEHRVYLKGKARVEGPQGQLTGNRMSIFLTEEKRIQKVVTTGHAHFHLPTQQTFSGDRIDLFFEPKAKRMEYFEVLGRPTASYEEKVPQGVHYLEAARIRGKVSTDAARLQQFTARKKVFFRSSALQVDEAHSDFLEGYFFKGRQELERLELRGKVRLIRSMDGSPEPRVERLRSKFLRIQFSTEQQLDRATASGNVHAELNSQGESRHLFAKESVRIHYRNGVLESIRGRKDCVLESRSREGTKRLAASLIRARYRSGMLERVVAEGGTALELSDKNEHRHTTSEKLDVRYQSGKLRQAVQSGQFHFWVEGNSGKTDLRADRGVYRAKSDTVTVTGKKTPVLRHSEAETFAQRFILDRETGRISAFENVRSILWEEGTVVTSASMEIEPETGWVEYTGNPRIVRSGSTITGRRVRVHSEAEQLIVEGDVESLLNHGPPNEQENYWISADRLVYESRQRLARFQGSVRTKTEDLVVTAPLVDLFFASGLAAEVREIVFREAVGITQQARKAEGQRAVYYPSEEKMVITGNPAQVIEPKRGQSSGRQLTFYVDDNRILVEGQGGSSEKP